MTAVKQRIAQQWPRVTVGLFALWGLFGGISILLTALKLQNYSLVSNESWNGKFKIQHDSLVPVFSYFAHGP